MSFYDFCFWTLAILVAALVTAVAVDPTFSTERVAGVVSKKRPL